MACNGIAVFGFEATVIRVVEKGFCEFLSVGLQLWIPLTEIDKQCLVLADGEGCTVVFEEIEQQLAVVLEVEVVGDGNI